VAGAVARRLNRFLVMMVDDPPAWPWWRADVRRCGRPRCASSRRRSTTFAGRRGRRGDRSRAAKRPHNRLIRRRALPAAFAAAEDNRAVVCAADDRAIVGAGADHRARIAICRADNRLVIALTRRRIRGSVFLHRALDRSVGHDGRLSGMILVRTSAFEAGPRQSGNGITPPRPLALPTAMRRRETARRLHRVRRPPHVTTTCSSQAARLPQQPIEAAAVRIRTPPVSG
jgi:hypothetical protein